MGNVNDGIVRNSIVETFGDCNVYSKESAKTVFKNFIVVVDVQQTHTISTVQ